MTVDHNIGILMKWNELSKTFMMISIWKKQKCFSFVRVNSFKPEFTVVIFIHYKSQIAVAILDL